MLRIFLAGEPSRTQTLPCDHLDAWLQLFREMLLDAEPLLVLELLRNEVPVASLDGAGGAGLTGLADQDLTAWQPRPTSHHTHTPAHDGFGGLAGLASLGGDIRGYGGSADGLLVRALVGRLAAQLVMLKILVEVVR